jgi:hypothetical protein
VFSNDEQFGNNDDGAGVPIKKRGFPVRPPSPTPQESNLATAQESSGRDATIVSISVGKSDCPKNPFTEVKKVASSGSNIDIPNLASQSGVVNSQPASVHCKLEPIANEGGNSKQGCNTEKIVSNDNIASANRSNWDLNTTMDAWGGSSDDAHQLDTVKSNESNEIVGPRLEVGVKVDLGKQNLGDNDGRTEFPNSPLPSTQYSAEDMVHLSVSPTCTLANCVTEPDMSPCSSASMPIASPATLASCSPACAVSDSVMAVDYELLGQTVSTKHSTSGINIKPEPSEGIAKHDSVAAKVNSVGYKHDLLNMPSGSSSSMNSGLSAVDCSKLPQQDSVAAKVNSETSLAIIKNEVVKSGIAITPNVVEEKQVKPELTSILTESTVKKAVGTVLKSQEIMNSCSSLLPSSPDVSNHGHSAKNANMPLQGRNHLHMCGAEDSNTFGSDDEKLDISADMIEEDSYGSESESDSQATKRTRGGKEEEDFEDGEIRESLLQKTTLVVATGNGDCENSNLRSSVGLTDNVRVNHNQIKDKDHGVIVGENQIKECYDPNVVDRSDNARPAVAEIVSASLNETQRRLDRTEELFIGGDKVTKTETKSTVGETQNDCKKGEIEDSCLWNSSLNARQGGARDADSRGVSGRSRIITLSRSSNVESPSKTRSGQESLFEWETRNERCTSLEEDKLQLQRKRGELFTDGPCRFTRDRFQRDQSFRGAIAEFKRGRGSAYDRCGSSEWVSSGRKFKPDNYSGEYRLSRDEHTAAINDKLELCKYHLAQDDIIASRMSGRKPLNDDFSSFHNASSRRSSPIVRDPTESGVPVVRRVGRNFSPREEESFDILGNRHGEKYPRNLPPAILDSEYALSQHANYGIDDQRCRKFSQHANEGIDDQRYRKFSVVQRRGIPSHAQSKSPTRTRMRSPPVAWSSPPRRRSPDSYNRIHELPRQQRSPPMHRVERARSPPSNFPDEFVSRRRGSPPYIARHLNDFERPMMPSRRSPSNRPIPRNNRRFDIPLDSYERPIRSSRFDEIDEERIGDDRRRLSERRRGRSFNGENLRFRQEAIDLQLAERNTGNDNNTREREFDRRIKSRPVIAPSRRIRAIEDQEGDFRQGGSAWHDDAFADAAREKRRRF